MSLCLVAGGIVAARLAGVAAFTLVWTHSVERTRWEEDWRMESDRLVLVEARVQGHGAGMEPPEGAQLEGGFWRWPSSLPPIPEIALRRSGATSDWSICIRDDCRTVGDFVGPEADPVLLVPCG
jgi:hypothetical protein